MANRIAPLSRPSDVRPRSSQVPSRKLALPDWKNLLSSAESFIAKNPGATLASRGLTSRLARERRAR